MWENVHVYVSSRLISYYQYRGICLENKDMLPTSICMQVTSFDRQLYVFVFLANTLKFSHIVKFHLTVCFYLSTLVHLIYIIFVSWMYIDMFYACFHLFWSNNVQKHFCKMITISWCQTITLTSINKLSGPPLKCHGYCNDVSQNYYVQRSNSYIIQIWD